MTPFPSLVGLCGLQALGGGREFLRAPGRSCSPAAQAGDGGMGRRNSSVCCGLGKTRLLFLGEAIPPYAYYWFLGFGLGAG